MDTELAWVPVLVQVLEPVLVLERVKVLIGHRR